MPNFLESEPRRSGRTNRIAITYVKNALQAPGHTFDVHDHHPTIVMRACVMKKCQAIARALGLEDEFNFNFSNFTLTYKGPRDAPAN